MPGVLIGGDARPAPGGVANFTGLAVFGIGGSGFQLRVQELLSKVVEATATFPVYPSSLALSRSTGAPHDVLAGDPLGRFVVSLLGAEGEILDSIQSVDNFTVIATAARISGDRQPVLLVGGPVSVIASAGNATFAMLAVPSVAGRVNVDFTFVRLGLSPLYISTSVRVFPNTLMVGDGGWGADGTVAVFVADAPITVNVTLLNIQGQPMTGVSAADNVTVRAYLLLQSAEAPAGSLRGLTEVAVDGGRAAFVLAVGGIVGTGFALRFELVALELGYDGVQLRNFSRPFNVVALELAIVPATPNVDAGGPLPTIEVQMLGLAGTPLNASLDFSLTAYLSTYVLRGCGTYAACSCPVLRTTTWAQCAAIAVRANTSRFALANRTCLVGPWVPPQAGVVIPYAASAAMPCNCSLGPATPEACDGVAAGTLDGSQRPLGGPGGRNTSTLGTVRKLIIAGLVTFDDLSTLAAGVNFTVRFRLEYSGPQDGGLPVEVFSPLFVLSPKYLTIAAAISAPLVNPVVVDRTTFPGIGSYAIELEALDGSPVVDLSAEDGMFVTATILHNGNDETTKYLKGTLVRPAAYSAFNSIHAYFDDLELIRVGQNLTLEFALTAGPAVPGPVTNISYTLGPFKCVPFALKIFEQCYNGLAWNDSAMSTIDHQTSYVLDCSGVSPGLPSEQGQFGYLTGYYFFNDNQYIGPLMKSVRNESRVPTIQVLATGLNHSEVLTYIDLSDGIYVIASVFMENDINASLAGNTTQPVYEGGALFNDLVLHSGAHCVGGCPVSLRFTVVGAACTSCYCATVQLTMSAAPIIPPNQLGTHPAFPGQTSVQGNLTLQGIDLAHFETFLSVFVEALVLSVGDQRFVVENVHVTSAAAAATANAGVRIGFNVLPISYGVGTLVVSRLPAAFRTGFSQFLILACQKLGFSPVNTAICTATIPSNGWTAPIRQFTAF